MKTDRYFCSALLFAAVAALALSCEEIPEPPLSPDEPREESLVGTPVKISPSLSDEETKINVNWNTYRVSWTDPDMFVLASTVDPDKRAEYFQIYPNDWDAVADPIVWGAGAQDFFAVFPADGDITIDDIDVTESPAKATISALLPAAHNPWDTRYFYRFANKHVDTPEGAVMIQFESFISPVRLTLKNSSSNRVRLLSLSASGGFDTAVGAPGVQVAGAYSATVQAGEETIYTFDDESGDTEVEVANVTRTVGAGASSGLTFFLLPRPYKWVRLSFSYFVEHAGGSDVVNGMTGTTKSVSDIQFNTSGAPAAPGDLLKLEVEFKNP